MSWIMFEVSLLPCMVGEDPDCRGVPPKTYPANPEPVFGFLVEVLMGFLLFPWVCSKKVKSSDMISKQLWERILLSNPTLSALIPLWKYVGAFVIWLVSMVYAGWSRSLMLASFESHLT